MRAPMRVLMFACVLLQQLVPADAGAGRNIEETEAWRVVVFWGIFLTLSYWMETALHHLHHYLLGRDAHGLIDALEKIQEELMVTGFVSLVLLVFEPQIVKICWSTAPMVWMEDPDDVVLGVSCCTLGHQYWRDLPVSGASKNIYNSPLRYTCPSREVIKDVNDWDQPFQPSVSHLFDCPINGPTFNEPGSEDYTSASFMDPKALHGVHTLIFLTVVCHVSFCIGIMLLSHWRIEKWTEWEFYGDDEVRSLTALPHAQARLLAGPCVLGNTCPPRATWLGRDS